MRPTIVVETICSEEASISRDRLSTSGKEQRWKSSEKSRQAAIMNHLRGKNPARNEGIATLFEPC